MVNIIVKQVAERIRRLEVQGATNIALTAMKAIENQVEMSKVQSRGAFLGELMEAKEILFKSRVTEPLMRNAIIYIQRAAESSKLEDVKDLARVVSSASERFHKYIEISVKEIAEIGARRIASTSKIITHCHSSLVSNVLMRAKSDKKIFKVFCTETRPFYQGRITARELLNAGIETTMIIDSAIRFFMNEAELVLVGADAITSEGNVVNKIGTSMIALAAHEARTPFYVVSQLLKFDPQTIYGKYTDIEERSPSEVWDDAPIGLKIRNPAFDVTRRDYIHGIICEEGIISPHSIIEAVRRRYPWTLEMHYRSGWDA